MGSDLFGLVMVLVQCLAYLEVVLIIIGLLEVFLLVKVELSHSELVSISHAEFGVSLVHLIAELVAIKFVVLIIRVVESVFVRESIAYTYASNLFVAYFPFFRRNVLS